MHTSLVTRLAPFALAVTALFAACSDSIDPASEGEGTVIVRLTDAPFLTDSVRSVNMYVVRVEARQSPADSAAADSDTDNGSKGGWVTIASPNASIDLLTLRNGAATTLGETELDAGTYSGLRFIIDPSRSNVVLKNGTVLDGPDEVKFPSGNRSGIKVNLTEPLRVVGGSTTTLLIDFDVNDSFVMRGNSIEKNGLLFKPVIKATVIDAATVNASIRLFNATAAPLNLLQAGTALSGGSNIASGASSSCSSVNAATPNLTVTQGSATALPGFTPSFTAGTSYTIVAYPGTGGAVQFATLGNVFTAPAGQAGFRVFNATAGATGYDVHVTSVGGTLGTPLVANQLAGTSSSYVAVPAGTSVVTVTSPGGATALVALPSQAFVAGQNVTLVIAPPATGSTAPRLFVVPSC